jgi:AcrR family transcriptional regulator
MAKRGGREADRRARGDVTRRQLIDTARALFVEPGYMATSVADIVARSGVGTRGAFYHHFDDKAALFRVVFEEVEKDLVLRAIADPPEGDPWARLVVGLYRFLDAALDPEVQQIMLVDAPAVLGWETRRAIEEANSIAVIESVLRGAMDEGTIVELPAAELAHVVAAVVEEGALLVARAEDRDAARQAAERILDHLLAGLLPAVGRPAIRS